MKYLDEVGHNPEDAARQEGYREGVSEVIAYIRSIHAYPILTNEIEWAILRKIS